ncbi:MAG: Xenobiotic-transporting ATPase [Candidatus Dadabacteria bacterium]|nr:Xenobiotic-transporting ATPase [Candidatus Dadabacteria bacterium]
MSQSSYSDIKLFKRLLNLARPYHFHITCILLFNLLATPLALLTPIPLKIAVDNVVSSKPLPEFLTYVIPDLLSKSKLGLLGYVAILQVLVVLLIQLQSLGNYFLQTSTGEKLTLNFRARLFRHVQRLSLSFHDSRGTADSIYRIQYDAPSIQWIMIYGLIPIISSTIMFIAMIYVTARIDFQLSLVALGVSPFLILYSQTYKKRMRDKYSHTKKLESSALKVVQEVLTAVRVVKAFGQEENEQDRFIRQSKEGMRSRIHISFAEGGYGLLVNVTTAIGTALVLFIGIRNVLSGSLSLGELLMVLTYLTQLYGPLRSISNQVATLQSSIASAQRAFELLDEVPEVLERSNALSLKRAKGDIKFENVSFSYDNKKPVLSNISFSVASGTHVGLVGQTGAGKTTLISLLTRFYDPSEGKILLDNKDLRDYKVSDLRNQFAIVLQEPVLFSTTIAENISYGNPKAKFQAIVDAAKAANAHDFIVNLTDGYDTIVGERGMKLSGGERQRIALARAFLKDASILILDEPTSSVDMKTETDIVEAIERLMQGCTTFMIAHRLSTLKNCGLLLVFEEGRLVEVASDVSKVIKENLESDKFKVAASGECFEV